MTSLPSCIGEAARGVSMLCRGGLAHSTSNAVVQEDVAEPDRIPLTLSPLSCLVSLSLARHLSLNPPLLEYAEIIE